MLLTNELASATLPIGRSAPRRVLLKARDSNGVVVEHWYDQAEDTNAVARLLARSRARVAELEQWNREMVAKAAAKSLDGYRELGARAAAAEERAEKAESRVKTLNSLVLAAYTEGRMRQDLHLRDPDESWRTSKAYAALRGEEER